MIETIEIHRKAISAGVVLVLAVLLSLDAKAKSDGISTYDELIEISAVTLTFPARVAEDFRQLPDRMDPTCPQCNSSL